MRCPFGLVLLRWSAPSETFPWHSRPRAFDSWYYCEPRRCTFTLRVGYRNLRFSADDWFAIVRKWFESLSSFFNSEIKWGDCIVTSVSACAFLLGDFNSIECAIVNVMTKYMIAYLLWRSLTIRVKLQNEANSYIIGFVWTMAKKYSHTGQFYLLKNIIFDIRERRKWALAVWSS